MPRSIVSGAIATCVDDVLAPTALSSSRTLAASGGSDVCPSTGPAAASTSIPVARHRLRPFALTHTPHLSAPRADASGRRPRRRVSKPPVAAGLVGRTFLLLVIVVKPHPLLG